MDELLDGFDNMQWNKSLGSIHSYCVPILISTKKKKKASAYPRCGKDIGIISWYKKSSVPSLYLAIQIVNKIATCICCVYAYAYVSSFNFAHFFTSGSSYAFSYLFTLFFFFIVILEAYLVFVQTTLQICYSKCHTHVVVVLILYFSSIHMLISYFRK